MTGVGGQDGCVDPRPASHPLIGGIRWDAWRENNAGYGVNPSFYANYPERRPFYGWFNVNVPNHQAIIDAEINVAADNYLDYFAFVWYPEHPQYDHADLMKPFRDYLASPYKNRIKFAFILQTYWVARGLLGDANEMEARWRTETVPALVQLFADPQYVKVNGNRPVIFWFGTAGLSSQPDGFGSGWQTEIQFLKDRVVSAGLGEPLFVDNNQDVAAAQNFGWQGVTSYGPSGAQPGASGAWGNQAAKDKSNWGPHANLLTVPGLTPMHDPRPRGYGYYVDPPTYYQWQNHLRDAFAFITANPAKVTNPPLMLVYAWNELDEGGGGIVPTLRDGDKYLSAIKSIASGLPLIVPPTPTPVPPSGNIYNGDNPAIVYQGDWTRWTPAEGNYGNDDHFSQQAGSVATLTLDGVTRFTIYGVKGPNRGSFEIFIDNVSQGTFSQYHPDWIQAPVLYQSAALPLGTHTLQMVNRAPQISLDYIEVQR